MTECSPRPPPGARRSRTSSSPPGSRRRWRAIGRPGQTLEVRAQVVLLLDRKLPEAGIGQPHRPRDVASSRRQPRRPVGQTLGRRGEGSTSTSSGGLALDPQPQRLGRPPWRRPGCRGPERGKLGHSVAGRLRPTQSSPAANAPRRSDAPIRTRPRTRAGAPPPEGAAVDRSCRSSRFGRRARHGNASCGGAAWPSPYNLRALPALHACRVPPRKARRLPCRRKRLRFDDTFHPASRGRARRQPSRPEFATSRREPA